MTRRSIVLASPAVVTLAAVTVLLAGCGSSSGDGERTAAATTTPASSTAATSATPPATSSAAQSTPAAPASTTSAASARLQAIVLRAADLPSGFQSQPAQGDSDDSSDVQLAQCTGVSGIKASDQTDSVSSPNFTTQTLEVSSDASSFATQQAVDRRVAVLKSPKIGSCLQTSLSKALGTSSGGAKLLGSKITVTPGSNGGPGNIVATAGGTLSLQGTNGQTAMLYLAVAFVTGKRLTATAEMFQVGSPVPESLKQRVFTAVANRARNA